ncbi:MAG: fumarylacetoacetate hydrolase family protein [Bacteroidia bacterium]|nr:fumarylacetoacetate hydrolase family protein [Bacteroidia bacterium]MDW8157301.1 fumarylacetoacetate hydrolase family protein [Bacteroidia bacterium]
MKIICVGRNYAAHAKEMQAEIPQKPVIFMKPDTAVLKPGQDFYYPDFSKEIHYECEVFFRIGAEGKYISPKFVYRHIDGIGLGLDLTARDLQQQLKAQGLPWEIAKAFNGSALISEIYPLRNAGNKNEEGAFIDYKDIQNLHFELKVNGELRQRGYTGDWIFPLETLVAYISQFFTLKTGDLIFTGTPAGVGPIHIGDILEGYLQSKKMFTFRVM